MQLLDGGLLAFAFLLLLRGSLQQSCPAAPPVLSSQLLTTAACGQTGLARAEATDLRQLEPEGQTWLHRTRNGLLRALAGALGLVGLRIINGSPATISEAPFVAYVVVSTSSGTEYPCSGSIIGNQWVLTAAHCFYSGTTRRSSAKVRVGSVDRTAGTVIPADAFYIHPNYIPSDIAAGNDIALVHLQTPLTFGPTIQPLCYPTSDSVGSATSGCDEKVYGWGALNLADVAKGVYPTNVQKLNVEVSSQTSDCKGISNYQLCVWGSPKASGPCNGDSGGPLVVKYGTTAYVSGVLSRAKTPAAKCKGAFLYTRASAYDDWVLAQIASTSG